MVEYDRKDDESRFNWLSNNQLCNTINNHYQLLYKVDFGNPALAIAQILIFGPTWIINQHTSQVYILKCGSRFDLGQFSSVSLDLLVTYASSFGIQASSTWFKFLTGWYKHMSNLAVIRSWFLLGCAQVMLMWDNLRCSECGMDHVTALPITAYTCMLSCLYPISFVSSPLSQSMT